VWRAPSPATALCQGTAMGFTSRASHGQPSAESTTILSSRAEEDRPFTDEPAESRDPVSINAQNRPRKEFSPQNVPFANTTRWEREGLGLIAKVTYSVTNSPREVARPSFAWAGLFCGKVLSASAALPMGGRASPAIDIAYSATIHYIL
jgi:hypothetical protein